MSDRNRDAAIRFLRRDDVSVLNWYQKGSDGRPQREAHLKVWAVTAEPGRRRQPRDGVEAMLVGSGNLTKAGLFHNEEAFAHATEADLQRLSVQLRRLRNKAWTRKDKILGSITPPPATAPAARLASCDRAAVGGARSAAADGGHLVGHHRHLQNAGVRREFGHVAHILDRFRRRLRPRRSVSTGSVSRHLDIARDLGVDEPKGQNEYLFEYVFRYTFYYSWP